MAPKSSKSRAPPVVEAVPEVEEPVDTGPKEVQPLDLTEAQLEEEIALILTAKNPVAPENVVRYNAAAKSFKPDAIINQTIIHYATDGWLVSPGSDLALAQHEMDRAENEALQEYEKEMAKKKKAQQKELGGSTVVELKNVFNFADRAMQTSNLPTREREVQTEPPPIQNVTGESTLSVIYDSYIAKAKSDIAAATMQKEVRGKGKKKGKSGDADTQEDAETAALDELEEEAQDPMESGEMKGAMKLMGRMISQNMFNHLILDYKYWEDVADQYRTGEGTLLPLWHDPSFRNPSQKRKHVTALSWNTKHGDMFAVGYGSFDFHRQGRGDVCIFSLKNPSDPELVLECDSGVMCLDFHPAYPNLLCVGLYDGGVLVYDVGNGSAPPIYQSNVRVGKHTDPVWQIRWQSDEANKALQFYSVSTDGRVGLWTVNKAEILMETAMELRLMSTSADGEEDDALVSALAGGSCLDFNQVQTNLFVVGTEEGLIHKCSKAYNSQYLDTYNAHHMPVYAVRWNNMHSRVFLSASADWTVKLWDHTNSARPFLSFDLGSPVGDACWSPHSSTVFAAVTADGKVHVFDLAQNKHEAICDQKMPTKKAKLTRIAFSAIAPVIVVGDEKGRVTLLKLSPNLRRPTQVPEGKTAAEVEEAKMERIISVAVKSLKQAMTAEKLQLEKELRETETNNNPGRLY